MFSYCFLLLGSSVSNWKHFVIALFLPPYYYFFVTFSQKLLSLFRWNFKILFWRNVKKWQKRRTVLLIYFKLHSNGRPLVALNEIALSKGLPFQTDDPLVFLRFHFIIIGVFRIQRKTLLLFYGLFLGSSVSYGIPFCCFLFLFIRVFRFQRKTLLFFLGFFLLFIIRVFCSNGISKKNSSDFNEIIRAFVKWPCLKVFKVSTIPPLRFKFDVQF